MRRTNEKKFRSDLKKKIYKSETNFTFENYVTKLNGIFNVLDKYGVPLYEEQELEHLLDQIMSPNIGFNTEVNIYKFSHSYTFFKASEYLSRVV